tara:strand:+ start:714 stop:1628 length:915 start_codon:yes stop_codon:yes gene_type:complete
VIKLTTSIILLLLTVSCKIDSTKQVMNNKLEKIIPKTNNVVLKSQKEKENINENILKYIVGDPYFIEGVKYTPEENYDYDEIGLASYYGKEIHNKKTINNDLNKVTELLGRHKTLPIPSIVKITNLDNGLSLTIKINDRHRDNSKLIQVSRKSAQLLKFYKDKIAKVRVEVLSDPSKQMKIVSQSMNETDFNKTIESAPTEEVFITNIDQESESNINNKNVEVPIELIQEEISDRKLFLKIYEFKSYNEIKSIISGMEFPFKYTSQNEGDYYSLLVGPLENIEANNLVLSFISKGYKKTEFILE